MKGYFWTNTIWYLLLFAATIATQAVALKKADNPRFLIAFSLAVLGLFFLFEYGLVVVLDAYRYHPMLVPSDSFQDTVLGNMFSQSSIMSACVFIISLRLKPAWYFLIAAVYYSIELFFVWLGVFELHWYKTIFTPIILVPLFWVVRRWHNHVVSSQSKLSLNAPLYLAVMAATTQTVFLPLKLAKIHVFTGGFFTDPSRDHTATLLFYLVIFAGLMIYIYQLKLRWYWKAVLFILLYPMQYAAFKAGLMQFREGWFPWVTMLEMGICLFWIVVMDRLIKLRRPTADGLPKSSGA